MRRDLFVRVCVSANVYAHRIAQILLYVMYLSMPLNVWRQNFAQLAIVQLLLSFTMERVVLQASHCGGQRQRNPLK